MNTDADSELVAKAQEGDRRAFETLMRRHQRKMYGVAFGVLRSREDALDVVQDALVKVHRNLHRFEGNSSFYTWLYRIVRNACIDHLRRKNRKREVEFDETFERNDEATFAGAGALTGLLGEAAEPGRAVARKEILCAVQSSLEELSENHRTVIVLREIEGLSYEEMATVMDCSKGTIMSRLFHARRKMQVKLKERLGSVVPGSEAQTERVGSRTESEVRA